MTVFGSLFARVCFVRNDVCTYTGRRIANLLNLSQLQFFVPRVCLYKPITMKFTIAFSLLVASASAFSPSSIATPKTTGLKATINGWTPNENEFAWYVRMQFCADDRFDRCLQSRTVTHGFFPTFSFAPIPGDFPAHSLRPRSLIHSVSLPARTWRQ